LGAYYIPLVTDRQQLSTENRMSDNSSVARLKPIGAKSFNGLREFLHDRLQMARIALHIQPGLHLFISGERTYQLASLPKGSVQSKA